jgi:hypothetical protein
MKKKSAIIFGTIIGFFLAYGLSGCQKIAYHTIAKATYIRVFNDLNYTITLNNKDAPLPFLTFLIDPQINANGVVTGAATMGDYLDKRQAYAPAYPAHAGNTGFSNPEYPGQANVLVGPIINGIDLSGWAQIPSGVHRIMFISRPITNVPFLSLDPATRSTKDKILIDTTVDFGEGDIYTMEVLNPDVSSNRAALYLRNEQFTKQAFSDSSVYVNFYNLSSKNYWSTIGIAPETGNYSPSIRDTMNVYLSLDSATQNDGTSIDGNPNPLLGNDIALPGYNSVYMTQLTRFTDARVNPYYSFPLFAQLRTNHITTNIYEYFEFFQPGYDDNRNGPYTYDLPFPQFLPLICAGSNYTADGFNGFDFQVPNLVVTTASGEYNPESFGTINTIEVINGNVYLMAIQRKYAPPIIH